MNIIDIQDQLKNFSEDQLINEMQMPSGNAPQFLVPVSYTHLTLPTIAKV